MLFIELTSMADNKTFWISASHIAHFEQGPNEADTIIQTDDNEYHVSEHIEYVLHVLEGYTGGCVRNYFPAWATAKTEPKPQG